MSDRDDFQPPAEERQMDDILEGLTAELRQFYDEQVYEGPDDRPVYTFWSRHLTHWAVKALEFFPPDRKLVLIGADLTPGEREWLRRRTDRPFFHIDRPADDKVVWELLCEVNRTDFGWMDADCFLRDVALLDEMSRLPEDAAFNSVWSHDTGRGVKVPYPHFVFVSHRMLADEALRELAIKAGTYRYDGDEPHRGRQVDWAVHRTLSPAQAAAVDRALGAPPEERDEPYFNERPFFEQLQALALAAADRGYRLHEVRSLGDRRDEDHWNDEIVHVSSVAYVTRPDFPFAELPTSPRKRYMMVLASDYLVMRGYWDELPEACRRVAMERRARVEAILGREVSDDKLRQAARSLMTHTVSDEELATAQPWRFLRPAAEPVTA